MEKRGRKKKYSALFIAGDVTSTINLATRRSARLTSLRMGRKSAILWCFQHRLRSSSKCAQLIFSEITLSLSKQTVLCKSGALTPEDNVALQGTNQSQSQPKFLSSHRSYMFHRVPSTAWHLTALAMSSPLETTKVVSWVDQVWHHSSWRLKTHRGWLEKFLQASESHLSSTLMENFFHSVAVDSVLYQITQARRQEWPRLPHQWSMWTRAWTMLSVWCKMEDCSLGGTILSNSRVPKNPRTL